MGVQLAVTRGQGSTLPFPTFSPTHKHNALLCLHERGLCEKLLQAVELWSQDILDLTHLYTLDLRLNLLRLVGRALIAMCTHEQRIDLSMAIPTTAPPAPRHAHLTLPSTQLQYYRHPDPSRQPYRIPPTRPRPPRLKHIGSVLPEYTTGKRKRNLEEHRT